MYMEVAQQILFTVCLWYVLSKIWSQRIIILLFWQLGAYYCEYLQYLILVYFQVSSKWQSDLYVHHCTKGSSSWKDVFTSHSPSLLFHFFLQKMFRWVILNRSICVSFLKLNNLILNHLILNHLIQYWGGAVCACTKSLPLLNFCYLGKTLAILCLFTGDNLTGEILITLASIDELQSHPGKLSTTRPESNFNGTPE